MKRIKKLLLATIIVFSASMIFTDAIPSIGPVQVEAAVKISKKKLTLIKGQKATLKITGTSKQIKWTSSNKAVATVSSKGKITAKKKGGTTITAKVGSKKYNCSLSVETPSISKKTVSLKVGDKTTLGMKGTAQEIKWISSNTKVVTVTSNGKLTAKKVGSATITATVLNKKYTCKVTIKAKSGGGAGQGTQPGGQTGTQPNTQPGDYVWKSATGTKYHKINNCGTMNPDKATKITLSEAKKLGLDPCSKCF